MQVDAHGKNTLHFGHTCTVRMSAQKRQHTSAGAATGSYCLQAELGRPVHCRAQQRDAVGDPVQHSQPVAHVADEVAGDFPPEVPEEPSEAVDADFGERAEDGDEDEEERELGSSEEVAQTRGYGGAWVAVRDGAGGLHCSRVAFIGIFSLVLRKVSGSILQGVGRSTLKGSMCTGGKGREVALRLMNKTEQECPALEQNNGNRRFSTAWPC